MKLRVLKIVGNIFIITGIVILIIPLLINDNLKAIFSIVGVIIAIIGLLLFLIFWKCPFCHTPLPFPGPIGIKHCPYCGSELDV